MNPTDDHDDEPAPPEPYHTFTPADDDHRPSKAYDPDPSEFLAHMHEGGGEEPPRTAQPPSEG